MAAEPLREVILDYVAKGLVEFIGTFALVHTICLASVFAQGYLAPFAIGAVLMILVFAWGHVSGAHYNPAVSTGALLCRKIDLKTWSLYIVVQILGAILSALIAAEVAIADEMGMENKFPAISVDDNKKDWGVWTEFVWTFLLVSVVLNVATTKAPGYQNNSFFGLAIGFTVLSGAIAVGGLSGGAFNPAVVIGVNVGRHAYEDIKDFNMDVTTVTAKSWAYCILADLAGAILAAILFQFTESREKVEENKPKQSRKETSGIQAIYKEPLIGATESTQEAMQQTSVTFADTQ